ncbi:ATPase RavA [Roseimaritima multifibrata]|uniref:ATPase RavA n=1 Tax=Roseimaritima multifibrata TaxID=1930274 RepID=A0A517MMQ0_9BACT|nr:AAA family ATPase [Roseimaritima multifibrata]QDS96152.1 ATPase RavA [Roseimaritima multifibrata]
MNANPTSTDSVASLAADDASRLVRLGEIKRLMTEQLHRRIVGQEEVIEQVLIALFSGGHCLLVGVPGLAKTLLVHSLSEVLQLQFSRIQFTPDLMPADITGTEVMQEDRASGERHFRFIEGPVFANIVLADEINRTPPKTQAALLEAMQEKQVTAAGQRHALPNPFFVLATQNPIEQEGTYPLPEAQLDRFMFDIRIRHMSEDDELAVVMRTTGDGQESIQPVLNADELVELIQTVRRVPVAASVARYATRLARLSRPADTSAADGGTKTLPVSQRVDQFVQWGAGPRGSQYLVLGAKAKAALDGRMMVEREDIRSIAKPVLRHRMRLNFAARAEGLSADALIDELLDAIDQQEKSDLHGSELEKVFRSADAR